MTYKLKKYNIYKFPSDRAVKVISEALRVRPSVKEASKLVLNGLVDSITFLSFVDEHEWKKSKQVLFPESSDILDKLLKSKYDLITYEGFNLPFDNFILNFPNNYKIGEFFAEGVLISRRSPKETQFYSSELCKSLGIVNRTIVQSEELLNFNYYCPSKSRSDIVSGDRYRVDFPVRLIPDILKCKNIQDYRNIISAKDEFLVSPLTDDETFYQFNLIKLVCAMSVYIIASKSSGKEPLIKGHPSQFGKNLPKLTKKEGKANGIFFRMVNSPMTTQAGVYRTWHLRQLVHEKFYKSDEWKNKPRGSRIIFVNETTIGATSYTLK